MSAKKIHVIRIRSNPQLTNDKAYYAGEMYKKDLKIKQNVVCLYGSTLYLYEKTEAEAMKFIEDFNSKENKNDTKNN